MDYAPKDTGKEADWLTIADNVERLHGLPHTDEFDTLLRENRLQETTIVTPPELPYGICIQEEMLGTSNLVGLFSAPNVTIQDFSLAIDTFRDEDTAIHGAFSANGTRYRIEQHGDMLLLTEKSAPDLPGFAIEPQDIQQILAAQIATYCEEDPAVVATILDSLHETNSDIESLHNTAFAFGNITGTSVRRISATFDDPELDKALIVQCSEIETPDQSERGSQLDIGYATEPTTFAAGELLAHERSIPEDKEQLEPNYHGVTITTDMPPSDVIDFIRLHGKLDEFDTLLGTQLQYPASKEHTAEEYGKLCQQLLTVIEPRLEEIASR